MARGCPGKGVGKNPGAVLQDVSEGLTHPLKTLKAILARFLFYQPSMFVHDHGFPFTDGETDI